jgi:hypothetical protein
MKKYTDEIWKDILHYEGLYQVSNFGRVKSLKRMCISKNNSQRIVKEIFLKQRMDRYGYVKVAPNKDDKAYQKTVHRLVAIAFIPNPNDLPEVNHKDGDKTNNHVDNLEWCDASYNQLHAIKLGLKVTIRGEDTYNNKLSDLQVLEIRAKYIPRKYSLYKLAVEYSVSPQLIHDIVKNKRWKHLL